MEMIAIDNILISDEIVEEEFVCDLNACKGGCCVDGAAGAPLEEKELKMLDEIYDEVKPFLSPEGIRAIAKQGKYVYDKEFEYTTPLIDHKMCAYGVKENGIVKSGIEKAFLEGKTAFKKPISCHLYPIRITEQQDYDAMNYEPRELLCSPACVLGKKLKVPVYRFLREPLVRKYGEVFYEVLDKIAGGLPTL